MSLHKFFYCWWHGRRTIGGPLLQVCYLFLYPFIYLGDRDLFGEDFYNDLQDPEYLRLFYR